MQLHNLQLWVTTETTSSRASAKQKPQNQQQPHYVTRKSYGRQHPVIFVQHNAVYTQEEGCKLSAQLSASETTTMKKSHCFITQFDDKITVLSLCLTV